MSGKRYRQRRRVLRAGGTWALKRWHDSVLPPLRTVVSEEAQRSWMDDGAPPDLLRALYSTPMGYADPLNRDAAVESHALYGGFQVQRPGPALRGITSS